MVGSGIFLENITTCEMSQDINPCHFFDSINLYSSIVYYKDILRRINFVGITGNDADLPIYLESKKEMLLILGLIWLIA